MNYVYIQDQELPAIALNWCDSTGTTIDFSSGWTFTVKLAAASAPTTIVLTKTTGVTGAATSPNVTIDWATTSELQSLTGSAQGVVYVVYVYARRSSDSKDRVFNPGSSPTITLKTSPT